MEHAKSMLENCEGSYKKMVSCRRHLAAMRSHFQNLFARLRLLSKNAGIIVDEELSGSWSVVETGFGNVAINTRGDVLIDSFVWEQMSKQLEHINSEGKNAH
jgi:short-subunit dehydrogenase involved in D-alanine esterification of teichoic acids